MGLWVGIWVSVIDSVLVFMSRAGRGVFFVQVTCVNGE